MEYKKDTLINVKKIENAIKGTNKVVMINGKFGRGKTTAVDLAINELRFRFFTDIINELKSYQNHANNKKDFEKEIIEKLLEKIQDLLEESSTEYEKLDDINQKKELLNNKDWIIKDLKKIVTSSFKEIECNNSKVNFDYKSLKKYERKTIKFFKTKLSNLENEIEENHKKTIKFDVGGEIGNDNYLFFLYDELIVNKKKHIFKFTILMMIIFLIYKLPLFNINIISDIQVPEFINQIIDYLNNYIHNVSIPNILLFFYILWYLCNYASVLKFMIMKKLGLESSNVFIKKQIESKLKNCKYIILDDMDRVYDKNTMYEVMKLISYLHTLINEKKINATLILIGNKDMINDKLNNSKNNESENNENNNTVDYMEKFCDEVIPFISQQEVILYNIKKETGLNDVSVIEDVENLRILNRILDGVLTIKSQFYQYFISIVENPVKYEDKRIKNLFNVLFNNKTSSPFQKKYEKVIYSLNWNQILILLRDKEKPDITVTNQLQYMLEQHYELNKINLCYDKYGLFDEKYQPENGNGIDRTKDIRGQFLEFETDLNKYLNNHPQKNETILLSMLVNFELKDLNGKYDSSGEIKNINEIPICLFSDVRYFQNDSDNSHEDDLTFLLPTINTLLNFANSFRRTSDGELKCNPNSHTQPPICDKSDDFFDLLFNLHVFNCDIEKVDNFVDILKVKTGNQNCSECDINYEIFMKIKRFLSIQLLYYHRKKLDLDKYISTYKYLEKNGVKIKNEENDFLLYELDSKYRDKDLTPEEETFYFGIKQAGTWN